MCTLVCVDQTSVRVLLPLSLLCDPSHSPASLLFQHEVFHPLTTSSSESIFFSSLFSHFLVSLYFSPPHSFLFFLIFYCPSMVYKFTGWSSFLYAYPSFLICTFLSLILTFPLSSFILTFFFHLFSAPYSFWVIFVLINSLQGRWNRRLVSSQPPVLGWDASFCGGAGLRPLTTNVAKQSLAVPSC